MASDGTRWVLDSFHVDEYPFGQLVRSGTGLRVQRLDASHAVVAEAQRLRVGTLAGGGGLSVSPDGSLLVVLADLPAVLRYDTSGELVDEWGEQGSAPGHLDRPQDLAVDAEGRAYVADTGKDRVQVFDADGGFLVAGGSSGRAPGSFRAPGDIEVAPGGTIVVADCWNLRIQRFAPLEQPVDEVPPDDPPPDDGRLFADVPPNHAHAAGIAAMLEAGITTGRVDGTSDPGEGVTRGQMATFLARALGLV